MIDIHSHIIPYIDDGAPDIQEALRIAQRAANEGITDIIATPHYIHGSASEFSAAAVQEKVNHLNGLLKELHCPVHIHTGCEAFITPELPELAKEQLVPVLASSKYILIELPANSIPIYTSNVLYELQLMELVPVIAHPERNLEIIRQPDRLREMRERGALVQMNAGSLTGYFGKAVQKTAWTILKADMADFIATDAHSSRSRGPYMKEAFKEIERRLGKEKAGYLFRENAYNLLHNLEIHNLNINKTREVSTFSKVLCFIRGIVG